MTSLDFDYSTYMTYFSDFNLKILLLKHEAKLDLKCKYYLSDMLAIFCIYKSIRDCLIDFFIIRHR